MEQSVALRSRVRGARRSFPVVPAAGAALLCLLVSAAAASVALTGAEAFDGLVERLYLFSLVLTVSFTAVAVLVWRHDRRNRIAAIAMGVAWAQGSAVAAERYAVLGVERSWPAVELALWLGQWVWLPGLLAIPTLLALRFPDGRLPSRAWRWAEALSLLGIALVTAGWALTPYGLLEEGPPVALGNPFAVDEGVLVHRAGLVAVGAGAAASLAGFVRRARRARGAERAQLHWAVAGLLSSVTFVALTVWLAPGSPVLALVGVVFLPAALAIAVVRHGLWDIDRILVRSLVYGSLTLAILGVYVVTVALLGDALGRTVGAPLVATAVVAVGAEPLRHRLQQVANRLVYGEREDPYAVVSRLGDRLATTADRGTLLVDAVAAVVQALRLPGAAIVAGHDELAAVGVLGEDVLDVPLDLHGERLGSLRVGLGRGEQLGATDRRLLTDLAHQVSATVKAELLRRELEASRSRLVVAREEERRRIRRDLHDGLGPTLASIGFEIERAALAVESDPAAAAARLAQAAQRVRDTVRSVRLVVEGLRPAVLDELGLDGAVRELVTGLHGGGVEITVETHGGFRDLPAAASLAAYLIVGEAVHNVLRHASATSCRISLVARPELLEILVEDDGTGLSGSRPGLGRRSMAERAQELGGTLEVGDRPGGGARVSASLPLGVA